MNDIITLPKSLQGQIQQAQNLLAQSEQANRNGNYDLAVSRAEQGMNALVEIAQRSPELAACLMAAMAGYRGIEFVTEERRTSYERMDKRFMGMVVGSKLVPVTNVSRVTRTIRFI